MAVQHLSKIVHQLRSALIKQDGVMRDGDLLKRFIQHHDEAAFEALVRKHGPMVMGVCLRILHNPHDAEDAFQATFLVLVCKAAGLRSPDSVGHWLYGVAYRTALAARKAAAKRCAKEAKVTIAEAETPKDTWYDLRLVLDQELDRLPQKYRAVIVHCDLEGKSHREVAEQFGWPEGTVASRLATARVKLAKRLSRHGLGVSSAVLATMLAENASAWVPPSMTASTVKAACLFAANRVLASGLTSPLVAALTKGMLKSMLLTRLKTGTLVLLAVGVIGFSGTLPIYRLLASEQSPDKKDSPQKPAAQEAPMPKTDKEKLQGTWVIVNEEFEGKPVAKEEIRPQWWNFDDDKLTVFGIDLRFSKPERSQFTYALDLGKNPKTIDCTGGRRLEGPRTKPPDDMKAIYKIDGDTLTVAIGKKELPTKFTTKAGDGVFVAVFKREGASKDGK
jgi:RNA polymerase sigma factor (sigma-70 family)